MLLYNKMLFYLTLLLLFASDYSIMNPFQKIYGLRTVCGFKKRLSSTHLLEMDLDKNCHLKKKIQEAIQKKLDKFPKIIIVPPSQPKTQSEEDNWEAGEVIWKPDELGDPSGNFTGYIVFPPPRPITPLDFAMACV